MNKSARAFITFFILASALRLGLGLISFVIALFLRKDSSSGRRHSGRWIFNEATANDADAQKFGSCSLVAIVAFLGWVLVPTQIFAKSLKYSDLRCLLPISNFQELYRSLKAEAHWIKIADISQKYPDPDFINVIQTTHGINNLSDVNEDLEVGVVLSTQSDCLSDYLRFVYQKFKLKTDPLITKIHNPTSLQGIDTLDKKFLFILSKKIPESGFSWTGYRNITYLTLPLVSEQELQSKRKKFETQLSREIIHEFYIQRDVLQNVGNGFAVEDELAIETKLGLTPEQIVLLSQPCAKTALAHYRAMQFEDRKFSSRPQPKGGKPKSCSQLISDFDPTSISTFFDRLLDNTARAAFVAAAKKQSDPTINRVMGDLTRLDEAYYGEHLMDPSEYAFKRRLLDLRINTLTSDYIAAYFEKYQKDNLDCRKVARQLEGLGLTDEVCTKLKTPTLPNDLDAVYLLTQGPRCAVCGTGSHTPPLNSDESQ
jgi:hypothetical protein